MSGNVRRRNPRREALEQLRSIGRRVAELKRGWNQDQMVFDGAADCWRKRRPSEQIETDPRSWEMLERQAQMMAAEAGKLVELAQRERRRLLGGGEGG